MNKHSENVTIRILEANETDQFIALIKLFEEVFEMKDFTIPDNAHISKVLNNESFTAVVAEMAGRIVGGATVYILDQYYATRPLAYIYDLAIREVFQRQGIGRKIIGFINEHFQAKGFEEVFVQADEEDDYVLDFYRSTKPSKEQEVRHFYYILPGQSK